MSKAPKMKVKPPPRGGAAKFGLPKSPGAKMKTVKPSAPSLNPKGR